MEQAGHPPGARPHGWGNLASQKKKRPETDGGDGRSAPSSSAKHYSDRAAGAMETAKGPRIAVLTPIAAAAGPAPGYGSTTGDARARAATNHTGAGDGRPGRTVPRRRLRSRITSPWPQIPKTRAPRPVADPRLDLARDPRRGEHGFPSARLAPVAVRPWATARATGNPSSARVDHRKSKRSEGFLLRSKGFSLSASSSQVSQILPLASWRSLLLSIFSPRSRRPCPLQTQISVHHITAFLAVHQTKFASGTTSATAIKRQESAACLLWLQTLSL